MSCPGQQGVVRVVDANGPTVIGHGDVSGHHGADGPALKRLVDKLLATVVWTVQGPKHVTWLDSPAVANDWSQGFINEMADRFAPAQPAA